MPEARAGQAPVNQSIARAAKLLGLFSAEHPELSLAQVTTGLDVSRATAHRYATALRNAGLLRMSPSGYALGPRIIELAATATAGLRVVEVAGPFLAGLVTEVNETVVLSVWDGEAPVVVGVDDSTDRVVRIHVRTGSRLGADSAQAKVFRAHPPLSEPGLAEILDAGFAYSVSKIEGMAAIAAPVFQADQIVATLALVGTVTAISKARDGDGGEALRRVAGELSSLLGHVPRGNRD